MKPQYVRERYPYSHEKLMEFLDCHDESTFNKLVVQMQANRILRVIRRNNITAELSDLAGDVNEERLDSSAHDNMYVFTYVGIVCVKGVVFKCYPKYLKHEDQPLDELKQIIRVLKKYTASREQTLSDYSHEMNTSSDNIFALMMYLLNDYYENGLYRNDRTVTEHNGSGEILWDKTINETYPIMSHGKPYYIDLYTQKRVHDDSDYFHRLHCYVLTEVSKELAEAQLIDLLDLMAVELSEEDIESFGGKDYAVERLHKELTIQFNTRKQNLLRSMIDYLKREINIQDDDAITFYGTNSFHVVWEKICGKVFNDYLDTPIKELPFVDKDRVEDSRCLSEVIKPPRWFWPGGVEQGILSDGSLVPDIITFRKLAEGWQCIILDGKYYTPGLSKNKKKLHGMPGVGDVTKQYLYQLALMPFLEQHDVKKVVNCFIMPMQYYEGYTDPDKSLAGICRMEMFHYDDVKAADFQDIQVKLVPPNKIYKAYLGDIKYALEELNLDGCDDETATQS